MTTQSLEGTNLRQLSQREDFIDRHIGPSASEIQEMLATVGAASLNDLIDSTVPSSILLEQGLNLPESTTEHATLNQLRGYAEENVVNRSMIGMGYYGTHVPNVILRNVLENPGWYTAYTPYQAEIAQGRLESLLTFQQMVMDLTGMAMANASLLDEATAAAEAMALCKRASKLPSNQFFVAMTYTLKPWTSFKHGQSTSVLNSSSDRQSPLAITKFSEHSFSTRGRLERSKI